MIQVYRYPDKEQWPTLLMRPSCNNTMLRRKVWRILKDVQQHGDTALSKYGLRFDGATIQNPVVSKEEITSSASLLPAELKSAIQTAAANIEKFHSIQKGQYPVVETMPGVYCWRKTEAIQKVGLYIPGGSAPLFSTVLMLGIPAKLAGCNHVVMCSPPGKSGNIHPAILYAAGLSGISTIYKVGGAQAIAAMAYGTETVEKVYKIFGPGNQFVTMAKQLVQIDGVAIDMPAGPSELCLLADKTANPSFIAADLLSQAEHGTDSQVLLVTTDESLANRVRDEIVVQSVQLTRKAIAIEALKNSKAVIVNDMSTGISIVNEYAPEHLVICCENAMEISDGITNAGSIFLGPYSPESAGDYASGTNHTLPTGGHAKAYSGVSVDSFTKSITCQKLTRKGLQAIGNTVELMAMAEGLTAHANAVSIRLKKANED